MDKKETLKGKKTKTNKQNNRTFELPVQNQAYISYHVSLCFVHQRDY